MSAHCRIQKNNWNIKQKVILTPFNSFDLLQIK